MDMKPSSFLAAFICRFLKMVSYPFIVLGRTKEQGAVRGCGTGSPARCRSVSTHDKDSPPRRRTNCHQGSRGESLKTVPSGSSAKRKSNLHTSPDTIPIRCRSCHKCPIRLAILSLRHESCYRCCHRTRLHCL